MEARREQSRVDSFGSYGARIMKDKLKDGLRDKLIIVSMGLLPIAYFIFVLGYIKK